MKIDACIIDRKTKDVIIDYGPLKIDITNFSTPNNMWIYIEYPCEDSLFFAIHKIQNHITGIITSNKTSYKIDVELISILNRYGFEYVVTSLDCSNGNITLKEEDYEDNFCKIATKRVLFDFDELKNYEQFKNFSVIDIAKYLAQGNEIPFGFHQEINIDKQTN